MARAGSAVPTPKVGTWVAVVCRDGENYSGRVVSCATTRGDRLLALQDGAGQWRLMMSDITSATVISPADHFRRRKNL